MRGRGRHGTEQNRTEQNSSSLVYCSVVLCCLSKLRRNDYESELVVAEEERTDEALALSLLLLLVLGLPLDSFSVFC